ncbi:hypothetical protein SAMN04487983_1011100 [Streptomyces sp. yr375]|nr:hypothetical protein SAMN04487983_1011100 [Streptomyces sp. yr375]
MMRARVSAGPSLRVSAMAVLLFGIVWTHGLGAESAEGITGHLATTASAPAPAVHEKGVAIADPDDGHGAPHPGEHCVSGQPQQGPVLSPPYFAVSVSESATVGRVSARQGSHDSARSARSSTALRSSVVQQV